MSSVVFNCVTDFLIDQTVWEFILEFNLFFFKIFLPISFSASVCLNILAKILSNPSSLISYFPFISLFLKHSLKHLLLFPILIHHQLLPLLCLFSASEIFIAFLIHEYTSGKGANKAIWPTFLYRSPSLFGPIDPDFTSSGGSPLSITGHK